MGLAQVKLVGGLISEQWMKTFLALKSKKPAKDAGLCSLTDRVGSRLYFVFMMEADRAG